MSSGKNRSTEPKFNHHTTSVKLVEQSHTCRESLRHKSQKCNHCTLTGFPIKYDAFNCLWCLVPSLGTKWSCDDQGYTIHTSQLNNHTVFWKELSFVEWYSLVDTLSRLRDMTFKHPLPWKNKETVSDTGSFTKDLSLINYIQTKEIQMITVLEIR